IARPANTPPSASEPVSPMKIFAGYVFHHRNPKHAPISDDAITARSSGSRTWKQPGPAVSQLEQLCPYSHTPMNTYAPDTITDAPVARPSRPSVRFTPLDMAAIRNSAHRTKITGPMDQPKSWVNDSFVDAGASPEASLKRSARIANARPTRVCPVSFA